MRGSTGYSDFEHINSSIPYSAGFRSLFLLKNSLLAKVGNSYDKSLEIRMISGSNMLKLCRFCGISLFLGG